MNDAAIKMINDDLVLIREKLQQECNNEQLEYLKSITSNDNYLPVFETIENAGNLFSDSLKMGVAALLSYKNALLLFNSGNAEGVAVPLFMGAKAGSMFVAQEKTLKALARVEKNAIKDSAARAGKISNEKKYPWRKQIKDIARQEWRKHDMLHNDLADWIITEYKTDDGQHPFSGTLAGIKESNERATIMKLLKEVAKDSEFSGRHLIKGSF